MASLGTSALVIALALALYSGVMTFYGARTRSTAMILSGTRATYLTVLALGTAILALVVAFLRHDFSLVYVAEHSNLAMPPIYTWVAFYAGNEGSLLYIAFALALMSALAMYLVPRRIGTQRPYANAVLMLILIFFVSVTLFMANPFRTTDAVPTDGAGINPLLTHPGMFIHPPMIMIGLTSIAVPFSLAMGGLISGRIDDEWVDAGRIWGIVSWAILGCGLLLGAWWAYTILGWGGYWGWDPVEDAAFMPWLALTAFIHSIMVQKRRGMFRMWNVALIIIAFVLAAFGIFINRGGPVPSVHSFGASTLGWVFLLFLGVVAFASLTIFFYRMALLRSSGSLESALSRESAFLVNNLLLLGIAFVTLWGVVFPLISELTMGKTITVGQPFYDHVNGPLMIALVFLMAIGPMLPWRHATWGSVRRAIMVPGAISLVITAIVVLLGVRIPVAVIAIAVSVLVAVSILQEWVRGTLARHRASREAYPIAFLRLLASNRPRYGGYIVHLAIVMLAFGIIGTSFYKIERDVVLNTGERTTIGSYQVEFVSTNTATFPDRTEQTATVDVYKGGNFIGTLEPWHGDYPAFSMLSTRAGIRSTPIDDLYVMFSEMQPDGTSAAFRLIVNPLVWWMWVSGPFLILGTVVALWPVRQRAAAVVPNPAAQGALPSSGA